MYWIAWNILSPFGNVLFRCWRKLDSLLSSPFKLSSLPLSPPLPLLSITHLRLVGNSGHMTHQIMSEASVHSTASSEELEEIHGDRTSKFSDKPGPVTLLQPWAEQSELAICRANVALKVPALYWQNPILSLSLFFSLQTLSQPELRMDVQTVYSAWNNEQRGSVCGEWRETSGQWPNSLPSTPPPPCGSLNTYWHFISIFAGHETQGLVHAREVFYYCAVSLACLCALSLALFLFFFLCVLT